MVTLVPVRFSFSFAISPVILTDTLVAASDEILLSKDKTIAIIDGSGTIHDPAGLDRSELVRLAKARLMVNNFDRSKLSKDGYLVLVDDRDLVLPCLYYFPQSKQLKD